MNNFLKPVFWFDLNYAISVRNVRLGLYDGENLFLTAVTNPDKIIIHNRQRKLGSTNFRLSLSETHHDISLLNINQRITAIETGLIIPDDPREVLFIGSESNLLAYCIEDNTDLFTVDVAEGVTSIRIGKFSIFDQNIVITGGNSHIRGYDAKGTELFNFITGGTIAAIGLIDFNRDGRVEIIAGSDDSTIRLFDKTGQLYEYSELSPIICIQEISGGCFFAFALNNGMLGVYEGKIRLWRIKGKHLITDMCCFNFLKTNGEQLITSWENGKVDIRDYQTGSVIFKVYIEHPVTSVLHANYRGQGNEDLILCTLNGQVRGYENKFNNFMSLTDKEEMKSLLALKKKYQLELYYYETNNKVNNTLEQTEGERTFNRTQGIIPLNTKLQIVVCTNTETNSIEFSIQTNNRACIHAVLLSTDGIFASEIFTTYLGKSKASPSVIVPMKVPKDYPYEVHIMAMVGQTDNEQFHIFELAKQLPAFSMYGLPKLFYLNPVLATEKILSMPNYVMLNLNERIERFVLWINKHFLLPDDLENMVVITNVINLNLICLRNNYELLIQFEENEGNLKIYCDDVEIIANIIQSIATFFNIKNLMSTLYYPKLTEKLVALMEKCKGLEEANRTIKYDISEKKIMLSNLMLKMREDAMCIDDNNLLAKYIHTLDTLNDDLKSNWTMRHENINEMNKTLATVNSILQCAIRLRVGTYANLIMNQFKDALNSKNINELIKIMEDPDVTMK